MTNQIEVDIDELLEMKARLRFINYKALDQIIWKRKGCVVEFSKQDINDFRFTGLCNTDFIELWLEEEGCFDD